MANVHGVNDLPNYQRKFKPKDQKQGGFGLSLGEQGNQEY